MLHSRYIRESRFHLLPLIVRVSVQFSIFVCAVLMLGVLSYFVPPLVFVLLHVLDCTVCTIIVRVLCMVLSAFATNLSTNVGAVRIGQQRIAI